VVIEKVQKVRGGALVHKQTKLEQPWCLLQKTWEQRQHKAGLIYFYNYYYNQTREMRNTWRIESTKMIMHLDYKNRNTVC